MNVLYVIFDGSAIPMEVSEKDLAPLVEIVLDHVVLTCQYFHDRAEALDPFDEGSASTQFRLACRCAG